MPNVVKPDVVKPDVVKPDVVKPDASRAARLVGGLRRIGRRARGVAWRVLVDDAGGIDDSALPSGYAAPYRRGTRLVRNLWHIPF